MPGGCVADSGSLSSSPRDDQVRQLLRDRRKIDAIRLVRDRLRLDLKAAKEYRHLGAAAVPDAV